MSALIYRSIYLLTPKKLITTYFPNFQLSKNINTTNSYIFAKRDSFEAKDKQCSPPASNTSFLQNLLNIGSGENTTETASVKLKKFKIPRERNTIPSDFVHLKTCYYSKKRLAQTAVSSHGLRHHFDFGKKDFDSVKLIRNELLTVDDAIKETIKQKPDLLQQSSLKQPSSKIINEKIKDECMDFTLY